MTMAALLPTSASALSKTNSDGADLVYADMALSRGDCRGGAERYLKVALASSDPKISERANEVASECQQIGASAKTARRWQKLEPDSVAAASAVALAAVRLYQPEEASAAILRTHALGGDESLIKLMARGQRCGRHGHRARHAASACSNRPTCPTACSRPVPTWRWKLSISPPRTNSRIACSPTSRPRVPRVRNSRACSPPKATRSRPLPWRRKRRRSIRIPSASPTPIRCCASIASTKRAQELESLRNDASIRDEAELRLGKLAYLMGDMTEAGRRFGGLIGSQSAAPEAFFYLSSIAEREGRTDLALEGFSKLAEAGAGLIVRGRAARLLLKRDERAAAFRMLDEHAAKERSELLDVEFAKAALLDDSGRSTEAIALLQLALERFPDHPGVRYQIALIQDKAGMQRESVRNFESLLKDRPRRRQPAERARLFARRSQPEAAARRNADPQGARGLARQSGIPRQPGLGALPARRHPGRVAAPRARVPHFSRRGDRLALGRSAVGQRQAVRGARVVGAIAGTIARIETAARHHRTPDRHEDGSADAGRGETPKSPDAESAPTPEPLPPPTSTGS